MRQILIEISKYIYTCIAKISRLNKNTKIFMLCTVSKKKTMGL